MTATLGRGIESAKGGSDVTVAGQKATETTTAEGQACVLNVRLSEEDAQQLFSIALVFGPDAVAKFGSTACPMTEKLAEKIVQSLPG
ncbi:hypothetical protein D5S19_18110 [Amycolatopsis panacis]|uniref:Uncharacterized protein n=1 Tax=Amycolatopsis panacis TaxID=2340917 RepID=A0A419I2E0_9PSEU|nr:hypothetical protein D5S19_18110 [Amycolatopsis panacis]